MAKLKHLHLQPWSRDRHWFEPGVYHVQDGIISLENITPANVALRKNEVFFLIKEKRMTRMADGLHIGCNLVQEGLVSLRLMFQLAW